MKKFSWNFLHPARNRTRQNGRFGLEGWKYWSFGLNLGQKSVHYNIGTHIICREPICLSLRLQMLRRRVHQLCATELFARRLLECVASRAVHA